MNTDTNQTIAIFLINGISSILGWNAMLATFDYFQSAFRDFHVYSFLPVPVYAGYLLVGFIYHMLSNKFKYIHLIVIGNVVTNIALAFVLIISIILPQTQVGFILLIIGSFFIGVAGNFSQISFYAMINYLSKEVVSQFTVGAALSGLFITVIRIIILAIAGADNTSIVPIILYFVIAIIVNTVDLFLNVIFCKSDVYRDKIGKFLPNYQQNNTKSKEVNPVAEQRLIDISQQKVNNQLQTKEESNIQDENYFKTLYQTCKVLFPYPFIIMFTFVLSFIIYPGPTFSITFDGMSSTWSIIIFVVIYNIGDTLGRFTADINNFFNKQSLNFVFFGRIVFVFTVTIMASGVDLNDILITNYIFPFMNQFWFAFTNGFCINASFIMAFKICPLKFKKYAGVLCALILQIGIMLGTIFQIPYAYAIGIN